MDFFKVAENPVGSLVVARTGGVMGARTRLKQGATLLTRPRTFHQCKPIANVLLPNDFRAGDAVSSSIYGWLLRFVGNETMAEDPLSDVFFASTLGFAKGAHLATDGLHVP